MSKQKDVTAEDISANPILGELGCVPGDTVSVWNHDQGTTETKKEGDV